MPSKSSPKNSFSKLGDLALSFDQFGESTFFHINGRETYNSFGGTLVTLMILLITISFAVQRLGVMQAYEDTNHLQIEDKNMNSVRVLP